MVITFLITSVFFLALIAIAIYFWQKPARNTEIAELPPPPVASLFSNDEPMQIAEAPNERLLAEQPEFEQQPVSAEQPATQDDERAAKRAAAEEYIATWKQSPDRNSTAQMLHLVAVADDAEAYDKAAELVLEAWQNGKLPDVSAAELQTFLNVEYWILSSQTRSSGAGFVLKRTLARAKRELESVNNLT
jgi:hypothetical protein